MLQIVESEEKILQFYKFRIAFVLLHWIQICNTKYVTYKNIFIGLSLAGDTPCTNKPLSIIDLGSKGNSLSCCKEPTQKLLLTDVMCKHDHCVFGTCIICPIGLRF